MRGLGLVVALALVLGPVPGLGAEPSGPAARLAPQVDKQGPVTVKVTPVALSSAATPWRFEVELETHVAPLVEDLVAVAVLVDPGGAERRPLKWEGDPPGGHHRKGVLVFEAVRPLPASVSLKIRGVGAVAERSFSWRLAQP